MDFNMMAVNWDNERRRSRAKIIADKIIGSIQVKEDSNALEFGCGTGLISFYLMDKFKHITLIDTSKGMIETLNSKIQDYEVRNMTALLVDINENSVLRREKYDVIYTSMVLHHIIDVRTTLKNLYEMLADNGYLCVVELVEDGGIFHKLEEDFNGHNGFNQDEFKKMLEELGFINIQIEIFYSEIKVIDDSEVNYSLFIMTGKK